MIRLGIIVLIVCIGLAVNGIRESMLGSVVNEQPKALTCWELEQAGYGDNAHITLSDFFLVDHGYVYEAPAGTPNGANYGYSKVWVPLVSLHSDWYNEYFNLIDEDGYLIDDPPPLTDVRVILRTEKAYTEDDVFRLGERETLTGIIVNEIDSIGDEERRLLEETYPYIEFRNCFILDHERPMPNTGNAGLMIGGGVIGTLIGAGLVIAPLAGLGGKRKKKEEQAAPNPWAR